MSILQLDLAKDDQVALEQAVAILDHPIDGAGWQSGRDHRQPGPEGDLGAGRTLQKALLAALRLTVTSLTAKSLWRSELLHKVAAAGSGALGGAFGLATLLVQLPISTTLILRSIVEILHREALGKFFDVDQKSSSV
jgi:hypothetical protein